MQTEYVALGQTAYFAFAANAAATGAATDPTGSIPVDVRLAGASASAAPTFSVNAYILTHANYAPGMCEVAIAATSGNGFAADSKYFVYASATVGVESGALIGKLVTSELMDAADVTALVVAGLVAHTAPTTAGFEARSRLAAELATVEGQGTIQGLIGDLLTTLGIPAGSTFAEDIAAAAAAAASALAGYDPPTRAEATADKDAILAATIKADVRQVLGDALTGVGTTGSPWGP